MTKREKQDARRRIQALRSAERAEGSLKRVVQCEQVRAAILAEPELPGDMPDCVWQDISTSRQAAVNFSRSIVQCTKRNILERLGLLH